MTAPHILMVFFYWIFLAGAVFSSGAFATGLFVAGPSGAGTFRLPAGRRNVGDAAARITLIFASSALAANVVHFVFHVAVMTETPLGDVSSVLTLFLLKTKYGKFTIARTLFLAAMVVPAAVALIRTSRWTDGSGILFSAGLLISVAMSGHQGAGGYLNLPFVLDVFHLAAIAVWIGGLFFIRICYSGFITCPDRAVAPAARDLANRFSAMASWSVAVALVTGVLLSFFNIKDLPVLYGTGYGQVLVLKALAAGFIFLFGGINRFVIIPRLNSLGPESAPEMLTQLRRLNQFVTIEVAFGFAVLLLTAVLTHLSPVE